MNSDLVIVLCAVAAGGWLLFRSIKPRAAPLPVFYHCRCCLEMQALQLGGVCSACFQVRNLGDAREMWYLAAAEDAMVATAEAWLPEGWAVVTLPSGQRALVPGEATEGGAHWRRTEP